MIAPHKAVLPCACLGCLLYQILYMPISVYSEPIKNMAETIELPSRLSDQGTVQFTLELGHPWSNGLDAKKRQVELLTIDGLCRLLLRQSPQVVELLWQWDADFSNREQDTAHFSFMTPDLPAQQPMPLLFTWDAGKGKFDAYLNGHPLRLPDARFTPWEIPGGRRVTLNGGDFKIQHFQAESLFLKPDEVAQRLPAKGASPFAQPESRTLMGEGEAELKRGELLYDGSRVNPSFATWIKEGPAAMAQEEAGWTSVRSTNESTAINDGHVVWWCPVDLPSSFIAEWEVQITSEHGLCIVFFAATDEDGRSIFNPQLPSRDGAFRHYIRGSIRSYHISYYANTPFNPGRPQANLRKNNHFLLLSQGAAAIPPGSVDVHRVRLVKMDSKIRLDVDDRPIIAYEDSDEPRYGKAYAGGSIGLRQMRWTDARYRNFKVWELAEP